MKKLVSVGPKKTKLIDVDMPKITAPNRVIIKIKYCGVCMSEHYAWSTAKEGQSFGHEGMGVVVEVGSGCKRVKVGDRVSGPISGVAEYVDTVEENCSIIPDNVSDEEAILEPLGCLFSAVSKVRIPVIGDKVCVVGCGYMGCGAVSLLAKRGAHVVAVDIRKECLENAKKYGAKECYTPDEVKAKYLSATTSAVAGVFNSQKGFPLVMEWGETNESLDLAINLTAQCGQLAIGAYHTGEKRLVDVQQLNVKAIDMLSTHPREWQLLLDGCNNALKLIAEDDWNFKSVPTKIYPITMFDKAQEELEIKYGKWMKALVDWTKFDGEPYIID